MSEQRLIDANALTERIKREHVNQAEQSPSGAYGSVPMAFATCYDMVITAPTIDAVPVVRCKECKHYNMPIVSRDSGICVVKCRNELVEPNDYCSCGARMDKEDA